MKLLARKILLGAFLLTAPVFSDFKPDPCPDYCLNEAKIGGLKCEGSLSNGAAVQKTCVFKDEPFAEGVVGMLIIPPSDFKFPEDEKKGLELCSQKCKEHGLLLTTGPQGIKYGYRAPLPAEIAFMPVNLMCYCKKG